MVEQTQQWLTSTVNLWQLVIAVLMAAAVPVAFVYSIKQDVVELQTLRLAGVTRNNSQDAEIDRLRLIAQQNQIAIAQINTKMDIILLRQDNVIKAFGEHRATNR